MPRIPLLLSTAALIAAVEVEPAKLATADAAPLPVGTIEVAPGIAWTTAGRAFATDGSAGDRGGRLNQLDASVGLTRGMAPGLDAGITLGWSRIRDAADSPDHGSGPSDLGLGAKWAFATLDRPDGAWQFGLLPEVTVPLGRGQDASERIPTASRYWTAGAVLAASGGIGRIALNADLGYTHAIGSDGDREGYIGTVTADAAVGVKIDDRIQPEIDLSWARDRVEDGDTPWSLTVTAGAQIALPAGRLGLGIAQVVAGAQADEATSFIANLAIPFE